MPYRLAEICARYGIHYYPIVSSGRAFNALWKRAYHKFQDWLGAVVYEDPWLAGGHNGLSNSEDPKEPESPFPRVLELRKLMRSVGLGHVPIVMAGGVWHQGLEGLDRQQGAGADRVPVRHPAAAHPREPDPGELKKRLLDLLPGDVLLHRFSPTGFYSSAARNQFLDGLSRGRSGRSRSRNSPTPR